MVEPRLHLKLIKVNHRNEQYACHTYYRRIVFLGCDVALQHKNG